MTALPLPVLAGLVVAMIALVLRWIELQRASADRSAIGDARLLDLLAPPSGPVRRSVRGILLAVGAGLLAAAMAQGGFSDGGESVDDGTGFETVLVLDASNSMLAEDVEPSRLRLEQLLARQLIGRLAGRIGIVYFAGSGYVLSPLTEDRAAALMFAAAVHPTHVGRGGTSLVDGLEQALVVLGGGRPDAVRSIVLLSDGENTVDEDKLDAVLQRARRAGISIHAIGLGTTTGARIPMPLPEGQGRRPLGSGVADESGPGDGRRWLRDASGRPVISGLDERGMRKIAVESGGLFASGAPSVDALLERLPAAGSQSAAGAGSVNGLLLAAFILLLLDAYAFRRA